MATAQQWIAGSRPRTLPMAIAPVLIGATAAFTFGGIAPPGDSRSHGAITTSQDGIELADLADHVPPHWDPMTWVAAMLALIVSLALQVGVNYANDYSDGIRGTDDERVGPMRLTGSGAASPAAVKRAAFLSFGVAGLAGLGIVALTGHWWLIAVGLICILAAWWYTGGKKPYGYLGLGEVMVFIFFGLVATAGTAFAVVETADVHGLSGWFPTPVWVGAVGHGLIASALLMANNVRDIPTDAESGKRTLAVRLGQKRARRLFAWMLIIPFVLPLAIVPLNPAFLLTLAALPVCIAPIRRMSDLSSRGPALIPVLQQTSLVGLAYAGSLAAAMLLPLVAPI